jgi:hypothetical protein
MKYFLKISLTLFFKDNTDNDVFEEEYLHISEESPTKEDYPNKSHLSKSHLKIKYLTKKIDSNLSSGLKPKYLKLFETTKIKENSALLLTCQVIGDPKPDLYW